MKLYYIVLRKGNYWVSAPNLSEAIQKTLIEHGESSVEYDTEVISTDVQAWSKDEPGSQLKPRFIP
jgi:hypothetical protein